jgi:hypothetical protein
MGASRNPTQQCPQARLARLAANAEAGQWSVTRDIDWQHIPRLPTWISHDQARAAISQLYHGELATAEFCQNLLRDLDSGYAHCCLAWQLIDEERHAEVYRRYLDQLGGVTPIEPNLAQALDAVARGPAGELGTMIAYHVIVEGEVLRLQHLITHFLPCPFLTQINRRIARDEARHVAFGQIFLAEALADWPEATRASIYYWLHRIWGQSTDVTLETRYRNSMARRVLCRWWQSGWDRHAAALKQIGVTPQFRPESAS